MRHIDDALSKRDTQQAELFQLLNSPAPLADSGVDAYTIWTELQGTQLRLDALVKDELRRRLEK